MHQAKKAAKELGVPLKVMNVTEEYMEVVRNPKHGRGRSMNPCIDCRIFTFKKAKIFMEEIGASFVITGEVLGERPMSQRRDAIRIIERESGLEGLIVRPLSAKLFQLTLPEKLGIVDRDRLLDIQGRRRDRQIALAKELGINSYPCPAGGCLLTDQGFSNRLKDLFKYNPDYNISDLHLLKVGRHFRMNDTAKLIVGRNERENDILVSFVKAGDYIFDILGIPSPVGLVRVIGAIKEEEIGLASSILARYSDAKSQSVKASYKTHPSQEERIITIYPATEELISSLRI
jgi:tRNA U34 2-thiouridine synthase MnmA/TrmU